MTKDGKVIGQIRYGYRPQYVFDSVNAVLLPENWRYEVMSKEIFNQQAVIEVKLYIRIGDGWLCKGSQMGQMQIIKDNVGDAYKGAVTDAIQKCLSLLSIGTDAYRGLLESVYKGLLQPIASSWQPVLLLSKIGNQCEVFDGKCLVLLCLLPISPSKSKLLQNLS